MGVLDPVPYMGVWEPYMGVRLWAEVIPLCLFAPLQTSRRVVSHQSSTADTLRWAEPGRTCW